MIRSIPFQINGILKAKLLQDLSHSWAGSQQPPWTTPSEPS
jgi:hypothetical protein